jgi:hypothetical protein
LNGEDATDRRAIRLTIVALCLLLGHFKIILTTTRNRPWLREVLERPPIVDISNIIS